MTVTFDENRRFEPRPTSGEAPFFPGEVFYSRTDRRGVIESGNFVFRRVADYEWGDLVGAPHKIIRHPDMPKGVFSLLWSTIEKGDVICAYVKNRAKDGLHYWVLALVTPWKDGYLSARIKPTSPICKTVEGLYAKALKNERDTDCSPEESAAFILASIEELGYPDYKSFAVDALATELQSECEELGLTKDRSIQSSQKMLQVAQELQKEANLLFAHFDALSSVPQNMQIKASRLEPTGGPLTALSKNYEHMSHEISEWFATHVVGKQNNFEQIAQRVQDSLLLTAASSILMRCEQQLNAERRNLGDAKLDAEREMLLELYNSFAKDAQDCVSQVLSESQRIARACDDMRRNLLGLNTVRVTCKIENARLGADAGSLDEIISQLGKTQSNVEQHLDIVKSCVDQIVTGATAINETDQSVIDEKLLFGEEMARSIKYA